MKWSSDDHLWCLHAPQVELQLKSAVASKFRAWQRAISPHPPCNQIVQARLRQPQDPGMEPRQQPMYYYLIMQIDILNACQVVCNGHLMIISVA